MFNKFDPYAKGRAPGAGPSSSSDDPDAAKRARLFRIASWVSLGMLVLGFLVILWQLWEAKA